jgi:hypothetical protein
VGLDLVDLVTAFREMGGAVERPLAHQEGRDDRHISLFEQLISEQLLEANLQQRHIAVEIGEARAGDPGRLRRIRAEPLAEVGVVGRSEIGVFGMRRVLGHGRGRVVAFA